MKHFSILAASMLLSACAFAAPKTATPAKAGAPTSAKKSLVTLNYCPMTGEKLPKKPLGATTYKDYNIAFCCSDCPGEFKALSPKQKDAKIAEVVAKQKIAQAKAKA